VKPAAIAALFGSRGAAEISVFHADVDVNGTYPLRLAMGPRLMAPHCGAPVVEVTATVVEPILVESCVEVAVMVMVSGGVPAGVNVTAVPEATLDATLTAPPAVGDRVRFTVLVKVPVPVTVGVHVEVCAEVMVEGVHVMVTAVMPGDAVVTVMLADPEMLRNPATAE